ncbi:tyrosine-type recombinase/integrase [Fructilactobacillus sanfranciscensis]|uniref:tyrosine-type recombinase/integrase n=1 Tax=Fructilactobacillus sanfranciscensis TaxID=1625 RepID=UPI0023AAD98F|nr:tyrosine-type recombinase/integrase [Fructilactobacillus sanfranciscensis]WED56923.1 tyrosine-type recombinase/integrase [Fructilactobacillus sanfranciscensis]
MINVRHTMIDIKHHRVEITTPKTPARNRDIHFGETLYKELIKFKLFQNNNKMLFKKYKNSDLVCTKSDGSLISPNTIKYHCDKISKELNIEFHFHMLRHTHATLLLEHGAMPKEVQIRLGHSKLEITMNTYVHITEKTKKHTGGIFEEINQENNSSM